MQSVLGLDIGTSACKAILLDLQEGIVGRARCEYPTSHPQEGWSEQNPDRWIDAAVECTRRAIAASGSPGAGVQAVAVTGQMHSLVTLDERGEILRPAILWSDTRHAAQVAALHATLGAEIRAWTSNPVNTLMSLPGLLWLREHEPHVWTRLAHLLMPKDYVRYLLCGKLATDPSDATGTLLYDPHRYDWSGQVLDAVGLPGHILPPVQPSDQVAGFLAELMARRMGLRAGIPVVTGAADVSCEAFAAGVAHGEKGLLRLGTAGVVCIGTEDAALPPAGISCYPQVQRGQWLLVTGTRACGSCVVWGCDLLGLQDQDAFARFAELAGETPPGSRNLLFLPHLAGERDPFAGTGLTGALLGLKLAHGRGDFARAVCEGIACSLRASACTFGEPHARVQEYSVFGEASKNRVLVQILADLFDRRLLVLPECEPALGAAMLAGSAIGKLSPHAGRDAAVVFTPTAARGELYAQLFSRYLHETKM